MKLLWLKLELDIFDNAKIKKIRRLAGGNDYFVLWIGLMTLGMKCKNYGTLEISDGLPYTHDDLASEFSMTPETVLQGLDLFEKMGMITRGEGNTIELVNFRKYQNVERIEQVRELARIRQTKRREKLKSLHDTKLLEYENKEKEEEEEEESARESRVTDSNGENSSSPYTKTDSEEQSDSKYEKQEKKNPPKNKPAAPPLPVDVLNKLRDTYESAFKSTGNAMKARSPFYSACYKVVKPLLNEYTIDEVCDALDEYIKEQKDNFNFYFFPSKIDIMLARAKKKKPAPRTEMSSEEFRALASKRKLAPL